MKVTFSPNGEITFEVATVDEALALQQQAQAARNGKQHDEPSNGVDPDDDWTDEHYELERKAREVGLGVALYATWEYLVQNEHRRGGTTALHVARALRITRVAANSRLQQLHAQGFAKRIDRGRYVARTP